MSTDIKIKISEALAVYNANRTTHSHLFQHRSISYLESLVMSAAEINRVQLITRLLEHPWNEEITTDVCVQQVLANISNTSKQSVESAIYALKLLANPEMAQANFDTITQCFGLDTLNIVRILEHLKKAQLLVPHVTPAQAQANFNAIITQGGEQYAENITMVLYFLKKYQLLTPHVTSEQAQANFTAITQGGWRYTGDIALALKRSKKAQLLVPHVTPEQAQANRDAITQGGGRYALAIARDLKVLLLRRGGLTNEQMQANFNAIIERVLHPERGAGQTVHTRSVELSSAVFVNPGRMRSSSFNAREERVNEALRADGPVKMP